jgi:hypothetical protein
VIKDIELPDNLETTFGNTYSTESYPDFFNPDKEKFHMSAGTSVMVAMNQNFVIAIDCGKAFNKQDGNIGFAIGLNYLF